MTNINEHQLTHLILGLGKSGLSCARYFDRIGQSYGLLDTRKKPPGLDQVSKLTECKLTLFGQLNLTLLNDCEMLIVSPGISLLEDFVSMAMRKNIDVCGDIELFARACEKPIIAITGSNGKSTVTDLTEKLLTAAGIHCQKGGNIGLPALDFLPEQNADMYVLELSSFQLDTTRSLSAEIAVMLNISEDHMDRYEHFSDYVESKQRIFNGARHKVFNWDDKLTYPSEISEQNIAFSMDLPNHKMQQKISYLEHRIMKHKTEVKARIFDLIIDGEHIINTDSLQMTGRHNWLNALACLNILHLLEVPINDRILSCLKGFHGLPHRFQCVSKKLKCDWINDSKATNVGATVAAIESISLYKNKLVLIAGGDSKRSDLLPLIKPFERKISHLVLLGRDANLLANLTDKVESYVVQSMEQAVIQAKSLVSEGDIILLSPACSSIDMYANFEARGDAFVDAIERCA